MRKGLIYFKNKLAGTITENDDDYFTSTMNGRALKTGEPSQSPAW